MVVVYEILNINIFYFLKKDVNFVKICNLLINWIEGFNISYFCFYYIKN